MAFQLEPIRSTSQFAEPQRFNYFTILWIQAGRGTFQADLTEHRFVGPALLFFNPYQTFSLAAGASLNGVCIQFHANFFCIETHHEAVGCNGVLFHDLYGQPWLRLDAPRAAEFNELVAQMEREFRSSGLAQGEVLVSLLKLFLIKATRLKLEHQQLAASAPATVRPPVLESLTQLLEQHFRTKHTPAEYAASLHMTPKALGKLVKLHWGRTLTELIRERWLKHAKWQLLHTRRSVKEIAWEVGFADELYFSRLFKRSTGCAPTAFREFETAIRQGRNLSI